MKCQSSSSTQFTKTNATCAAAAAGESDASTAGSVSQRGRSVLLRQSDGTWRHSAAVQCATTSVPRWTTLTTLTSSTDHVHILLALTTSTVITNDVHSRHWPRPLFASPCHFCSADCVVLTPGNFFRHWPYHLYHLSFPIVQHISYFVWHWPASTIFCGYFDVSLFCYYVIGLVMNLKEYSYRCVDELYWALVMMQDDDKCSFGCCGIWHVQFCGKWW